MKKSNIGNIRQILQYESCFQYFCIIEFLPGSVKNKHVASHQEELERLHPYVSLTLGTQFEMQA